MARLLARKATRWMAELTQDNRAAIALKLLNENTRNEMDPNDKER